MGAHTSRADATALVARLAALQTRTLFPHDDVAARAWGRGLTALARLDAGADALVPTVAALAERAAAALSDRAAATAARLKTLGALHDLGERIQALVTTHAAAGPALRRACETLDHGRVLQHVLRECTVTLDGTRDALTGGVRTAPPPPRPRPSSPPPPRPHDLDAAAWHRLAAAADKLVPLHDRAAALDATCDEAERRLLADEDVLVRTLNSRRCRLQHLAAAAPLLQHISACYSALRALHVPPPVNAAPIAIRL